MSHLELDLVAPPFGWLIELDRRGIEVLTDDIGRKSISRSDARMLLDEQAAAEAEKARRRQLAKAKAVADDQLRRARIWQGVPAAALPEGMAPATAMLLGGDERPRRRSPVAEVLDGDALLYHSYGDQEAS